LCVSLYSELRLNYLNLIRSELDKSRKFTGGLSVVSTKGNLANLLLKLYSPIVGASISLPFEISEADYKKELEKIQKRKKPNTGGQVTWPWSEQ